MPLCFIDLQNFFYLQVKSVIAPGQPFGQILVDRGFGDAEVSGGIANGRPVFCDVLGQIAGSFFHELLQSQHSLHIVIRECMPTEAAV